MKAFCDSGGINEEAAAKCTADVWIELVERELRLSKKGGKTVMNGTFVCIW